MILETRDRRILAALRCVDGVTGTPLRQPFLVRAEGYSLIRNRSGIYVIRTAPGFAALRNYSDSFDQPPAAPPPDLSWPVTAHLQISDPSSRYLPRQLRLPLPRASDADAGDSMFRAVDVPLYPSPSAPTGSAWAVVRATVLQQSSDADAQPQRLPWAWIRVQRDDAVPLDPPSKPTFAQADWRGEALIAVAGIPSILWDGSSTSTPEVPVRLEVVFDSDLTPLPEEVDWSQFRDPNQGYVPNPEYLDSSDADLLDGQFSPYTIASGRDPPALRLQVPLMPRS